MGASRHKVEVGNRLRITIEALGKTQVDVAKALGVTPSKLGNWLRGDNYPPNIYIAAMCDRFNITADWLIRGVVSGVASPLADNLWKSGAATEVAAKEAVGRGNAKNT